MCVAKLLPEACHLPTVAGSLVLPPALSPLSVILCCYYCDGQSAMSSAEVLTSQQSSVIAYFRNQLTLTVQLLMYGVCEIVVT